MADRIPTIIKYANELTPHPDNYNHHPKGQITQLAESLTTFGQFKNTLCGLPTFLFMSCLMTIKAEGNHVKPSVSVIGFVMILLCLLAAVLTWQRRNAGNSSTPNSIGNRTRGANPIGVIRLPSFPVSSPFLAMLMLMGHALSLWAFGKFGMARLTLGCQSVPRHLSFHKIIQWLWVGFFAIWIRAKLQFLVTVKGMMASYLVMIVTVGRLNQNHILATRIWTKFSRSISWHFYSQNKTPRRLGGAVVYAATNKPLRGQVDNSYKIKNPPIGKRCVDKRYYSTGELFNQFERWQQLTAQPPRLVKAGGEQLHIT